MTVQTVSTKPRRQLSVVILNWNAAQETIGCVKSVSSWRGWNTEIWVVDNASYDDSVEEIARRCPRARLVCNAENLGFGGGNNRGLEQVLTSSDAPILLLNNDADIAETDMTQLWDTLDSHAELGCAGPLIYDRHEQQRLLSAGGRDISRHVQTHITATPPKTPLIAVDYVPGTAILIRAQALRQVGLLDERYFFSGEIADLCERMKQNGYSCAIDARSRAYHERHTRLDRVELLRTYYSIRNRFLFIKKFRSELYYGAWLFYALAMSLNADLKREHLRARAIRLGVRDARRGQFCNQNERVLGLLGSGVAGRLDNGAQ
jgi:GT2 family glycosyltransferase